MTENEQLVESMIRSRQADLCAAVGGQVVFREAGPGVTCLLAAIQDPLLGSLGPLDWGDKVVGRAAALLFSLLQPRSVFGSTMSAGAQEVLAAAGIPYRCDATIPVILDRSGTRACPLEQAVSGTADPHAAFDTLTRLQAGWTAMQSSPAKETT
jgi:hypothetical protein